MAKSQTPQPKKELSIDTMLIAHPDDEVIFGWPVLKNTKRIVCISNDRDNPTRPYGNRRLDALKKVCDTLKIELNCLDYWSEFYRLNARDGKLERLVEQVLELLKPCKGSLYTHNLWGEYGHLDHILTHQIAVRSGLKLINSDIAINAGWFDVVTKNLGKEIAEVELEEKWYEGLKSFYDQQQAWTWSKDPITKAKLYEINNSSVSPSKED